jgi:hypothetical protein
MQIEICPPQTNRATNVTQTYLPQNHNHPSLSPLSLIPHDLSIHKNQDRARKEEEEREE